MDSGKNEPSETRSRMECLADKDLQNFPRDLQILIATNGTLTRMLKIIEKDEIFVHIISQEIHEAAPYASSISEISKSRVLRRRVLLKGKNTAAAFVAAESIVAIDLLPTSVVTSLLESTDPIGEVIIFSRLETFKESPRVWLGDIPKWAADAARQREATRIAARMYRVITGGDAVMTITEYFLQNAF